MGTLDKGFPLVDIVIRGTPVTINNPVLYQFLSDAKNRGQGIDAWFVEPWTVVRQGNSAGDAPEPWIYKWQTIAPVTVQADSMLDGSGGYLYLRAQNPARDMTAIYPGAGEIFMTIDPDGNTQLVGGYESNGQFWNGFAKAAIIWAAVVVTAVVASGYIAGGAVVSDVAAAGAIEGGATATVAETTVATTTTAGPAGFSFAEIVAGAKTTTAAATTVISAAKAVQSAGQNVSANQLRAAAQLAATSGQAASDIDTLAKNNNAMMAVAAVVALLVIG